MYVVYGCIYVHTYMYICMNDSIFYSVISFFLLYLHTSRSFAWISVYHHLAFPEHYNISTLLNEFSVEDRERVIEALSGTLTIGPSGGQGPQMSEYLDSLKEWTQENGEL